MILRLPVSSLVMKRWGAVAWAPRPINGGTIWMMQAFSAICPGIISPLRKRGWIFAVPQAGERILVLGSPHEGCQGQDQ